MEKMILTVSLILVASATTASAENARPIAAVHSPDGNVKVEFSLKDGQPRWNVWLKEYRVIADGLLGIETSPENFSGVYELAGTETASADTTWKPVWGELSEVPDRYNECTFKLQETAGKRRVLHVILRVYDEGVALRYDIPNQPGLSQVTIKKRLTEFRFTANHPIYQCRNYEYGTAKIDSMSRSEGAVTVDLGNGSFAALTDADRSNFPVTFWHNAKDKPCTVFGRLHSDAASELPFSTSWEVLMLGSTAAKLCENRYLVENLNPPCAIADTSWIRPENKAICQVRNTRIVTSELKKLCDFASAHNIPYLEIDHSWCGAETRWTPQEIEYFEKNKSKFWSDKPEWRSNVGGNLFAPAVGWVPFRPKADSGGNFVDLNIPELVAYANRLNPKVGICVYVRGEALKEFGGEHAIEDVFAAYEKWGLAGVKPGFVPSSSQQNERTIAYLVKKAAEHKLIACIHDAYLPSGLSRTYPNLVNVEGLAGEEAEHSIPRDIKSRHDVMLPFTRGLMGPFDYTPEIYKSNSIKTHCHQVAMLGVYHGRVSIRGGMRQWSPGGEGGGEIEFVDKLPGLFDEKRVFTRLGEYVTVARRRGETWFVASMSDGSRRVCSLPLEFLRPGTNYRASIYADAATGPEVTHEVKTVSSASVIEIDMQPNGGHLMMIEPVGAEERALSLDAVDFGVRADGVTDDGPAIARLLEAAAAAGTPVHLRFPARRTVRVERGVDRYAFRFHKASRVTLDGGGCTFVLGPTARFLHLTESRDITIRNLKIDFDPLPFAEGTVVAVDQREGFLDVRLSSRTAPSPLGGPTRTDGEQAFFGMLWHAGPYGPGSRHYWIARTEATPQPNIVRAFGDEQSKQFGDIKPEAWRVSLPVPGIAHRFGPGACLEICDNDTVTFEDIELWSAPWFGFHVMRNRGKVTFRRVHIRPKPESGRLMSTWRDGFHVKGNSASLLWEDCILSGMNDDAFNLSTHCSRVTKVLSPTEFTVEQSFPLNPMPWHEGATLAAADYDARARLGNARILRVRSSEHRRMIAGKPAASPVSLQIDRPIAGLEAGTMVWQPEYANPDTTLRRCKIEMSCRFQTPVTLESCEVTALLWFYGEEIEGPFPSRIVLRDCTLRRGRGNAQLAVSIQGRKSGQSGSSAIQTAAIEGNQIWGDFSMEGVDRARFENNQLREPGAKVHIEGCPGL